MPKIKLDDVVFEKAKRHVRSAGYSSLEEFVTHCIRNELDRFDDEDDPSTDEPLLEPGYLE